MRRLTMLSAALLCSGALAVGSVDVDAPAASPAVTVPVSAPATVPAPVMPPTQAPTSEATVNVTPPVRSGAAWWEIVVGIATAVGIPTLTAFLGHRFGMRQQADNVAIQRDNVDLTALQNRDAAFTNILTLLTQQQQQRDPLIAENASLKTRQEALERQVGEQGAAVAGLQTRLTDLTAHLNSCAGGQPCPLAARWRTT